MALYSAIGVRVCHVIEWGGGDNYSRRVTVLILFRGAGELTKSACHNFVRCGFYFEHPRVY